MVAVMQPTFLPWCGYFDLMDQVDRFVYLDSVQFAHRSWQHRNQIQTPNGLAWIAAPTKSANRREQTVASIELGDSPDFPRKPLALLRENLRNAPHVQLLDPVLEILESADDMNRLVELNLALIDALRTILGITTPLDRTTELPVTGSRSDLLISATKAVEGNRYLSPPGSLDYLLGDQALFDAADLPVWIQQYEHPEYPQQFSPFAPYASVVDLIANTGTEALAVLRSGRRAIAPLEQFAGASL